MNPLILRLGMGLMLFAGLAACTTTVKTAPVVAPAALPAYPETTFAVVSDLHFYDPALGTEGPAFQAYLDRDRKLLRESGELLDVAVAALSATDAAFVLVCGDLTKDGEASGHRLVARRLGKLAATGKRVLVVPGNHDVANGEAVRYTADGTEPVPTVDAGAFAEIYKDFGYSTALARDPSSLSYLAEPVDGLWVLALDSCLYRKNRPDRHPRIGGAFPEKTVRWIAGILERARREGKALIAFQHHGVLEHYPGNEKYYDEYLVDDHAEMADMLSRGGVTMVFTGHFHAQDITGKRFGDGRVIYDIETGSTVTAPCPYRLVTLTGGHRAVIESRFIGRIPSRPSDFAAYAEADTLRGTVKLADAALKKYYVPEADRQKINPQVAESYVTHLKGDEPVPPAAIDTRGLGFLGRLVVGIKTDLLTGWRTDLPPADNDVVLDLRPAAAD